MSHLVRGVAGIGWGLSPKTTTTKQWRVLSTATFYGWKSDRHYPCCIAASRQRSRYFSSRSGRQQGGFQLDALAFSISPEEALSKFQKWSVDDQGLNYLLSWNSIRIGATYVPVWSFDLNIRFAVTDSHGRKRYDWKPSVFSNIYSSQQSVIHLPGLGAYAGYSYRRSLVHPIVNTSLVFMGDKTVPFEKFMLRDMKLQATGERIEVVPDPWNATRAQAFATLVEDLEKISAEADGTVQVQTEIVASRRVYLPVYLIDYSILGIEYRAFTSGCDTAAGVSGVDHRVFGNLRASQEMNQSSQSFLSDTWAAAQTAAQFGLRTFNGRQLFTVIAIALQFFGNILARVVMRIPVVAFFGSILVGFRKIIFPFIETRRSSAEWERQREHEAQMHEGKHSYGDDFTDNGSAQRYFYRNQERIVRYLGGVDDHAQGDFDWYKDWEEWARRQWQQQQQQQQSSGGGYGQQQQSSGGGYRQQRQQQQRPQQQKAAKPKFEWDFDPNDPYSVLGVRRGSTKAEVAAAFRREMLKHHPDTQAGASDAQKLRASERSKLISAAYRTIKTSMKK